MQLIYATNIAEILPLFERSYGEKLEELLEYILSEQWQFIGGNRISGDALIVYRRKAVFSFDMKKTHSSDVSKKK